jgi:hypothetical protein
VGRSRVATDLRRLARGAVLSSPARRALPVSGAGVLRAAHTAPVVSAFNSSAAINWRYTDDSPCSPGSILAAVHDALPRAASPPQLDGSPLLPRTDARRAALRRNLAARGCDDAAVDQILDHNWATSTSDGHDSAWRQWERHCAERLDSTRRDCPTAADLVNFLQRVRDGDFSDKDVDTFSAEWVRKVRSSVSITVSMWSDAGLRIGEHPLVTSFIQSLTNDDMMHRGRRKYRYDDTWDVEALFQSLLTIVSSAAFASLRATGGRRFVHALRDVVIPLARVLLCCRSSDLRCVFRGDDSDHECIRFSFDNYGNDNRVLSAVSVRYYAPKQRRSMPTAARGYTDWVTVDVVDATHAVVPCLATLLYEYYSLTQHLPNYDDALLLTVDANAAHDGKHWGLSSDRLANVMRSAMTAAGVPADFLPHSARHAGIAFQRSQGMCDDDVMHRANMQAATYVRHYRRHIRSAVG